MGVIVHTIRIYCSPESGVAAFASLPVVARPFPDVGDGFEVQHFVDEIPFQ